MKTKSRTKPSGGGYDNSQGVAPYSANSRTGEPISNPARSDPRNAAAEKQYYSRSGSGRREMQADQIARKAARQSSAEQQEQVKVRKRGSH
jgi:hypothetical protein